MEEQHKDYDCHELDVESEEANVPVGNRKKVLHLFADMHGCPLSV